MQALELTKPMVFLTLIKNSAPFEVMQPKVTQKTDPDKKFQIAFKDDATKDSFNSFWTKDQLKFLESSFKERQKMKL